jgi:endogenous inhibitor of DNA gyrase (YacG/DUF329 family)
MEAKPTPARHPRCPTCRQPVLLVAGAARPSWMPFCSERCKLIDLDKWIRGDHAIPGEEVPPELLQE